MYIVHMYIDLSIKFVLFLIDLKLYLALPMTSLNLNFFAQQLWVFESCLNSFLADQLWIWVAVWLRRTFACKINQPISAFYIIFPVLLVGGCNFAWWETGPSSGYEVVNFEIIPFITISDNTQISGHNQNFLKILY